MGAGALFPDPDPARAWLANELSKPDYQPSLYDRIAGALQDLLNWLTRNLRLGEVTISWILIVALFAIVLIVGFALTRLRRSHRLADADHEVFGDERRSAADHRALAKAALAEDDMSTVVIESMRALTSDLIERGVVPDLLGLTSREVVESAARRFPSFLPRLRAGSRVFDETRFGGRTPSGAQAEEMMSLDHDLSMAEPTGAAMAGPVMAVPR